MGPDVSSGTIHATIVPDSKKMDMPCVVAATAKCVWVTCAFSLLSVSILTSYVDVMSYESILEYFVTTSEGDVFAMVYKVLLR